MNPPNKCLRCGGPMEAGFVLDRGHHSTAATQDWIEGTPERSFWTGIKTKGKEKHGVRSFRCERCGLLESYALGKRLE
jgi:hypothetical protein